jgi:arylsulfatase A-like enzyme
MNNRSLFMPVTRRQFLKSSAIGGAALMTGTAFSTAVPADNNRRPNFLFITTDQQGLDTISANGCRDIHTPNMDRLARSGVSFSESHTTNPLCSPARSSMFTGRMPSETGVVVNNRPIRSDIPNMGQWLSQEGYETVYIGKWHVPASYTSEIPGFEVIPAGIGGQGNIGDAAVSRACQGYLRNRTSSKPFFLVASFLQPHDICQYVSMHRNAPDEIPYPGILDQLPELPPNFSYDPREPQKLRNFNRPSWSEQQWRYYIWSYYRHVEMVDAEIGRVLQALDDSGEAENTVIIFTSDHGEGRGRHQMVLKNYLYEEAEKVPLMVSWPGRIPEGKQDMAHLVSGLDIAPTMCDYAGVKPPQGVLGRSLKPILEGKTVEWHEFVAAEVQKIGRMIRTPNYKYVAYSGDPVEQLFDMKADPGETKNLAGVSQYDTILEDHRKLLREWEERLDVAPETP